MNLCTDVIDAEPKTGQKNTLCIITPEQEYYIRGDNKEIINGYVAHAYATLVMVIFTNRYSSVGLAGSLKVTFFFF